MKRLLPELPEEKRILRHLERQHGDQLPGSLGALEAISDLFKGSAPITVYWFVATHRVLGHEFVDGEDEVALNLKSPSTKTFNIPIEIRHEVQPRRLRRLSAFLKEQRRRLMKDHDVFDETPFILRESIYRRHFHAMKWEFKHSKHGELAIFPVQDIFFNLRHRKVYLLVGATDDDTLD